MANKKKNNYVSKDKLGNNFVHKESKEEKNKSPKVIGIVMLKKMIML